MFSPHLGCYHPFRNPLEAPLLSQDPPALSIVVPAYNEEEVLPQFHARLAAALADIGLTWEVVYVNDGSKDGTLAVMLGLQA